MPRSTQDPMNWGGLPKKTIAGALSFVLKPLAITSVYRPCKPSETFEMISYDAKAGHTNPIGGLIDDNGKTASLSLPALLNS